MGSGVALKDHCHSNGSSNLLIHLGTIRRDIRWIAFDAERELTRDHYSSERQTDGCFETAAVTGLVEAE